MLLCDVYCVSVSPANPRFSPPSVSISLKEQQHWVEVSFPCAPDAVCQAMKQEKEEEGDEEAAPTCCPLTDFLELNTTVILYNKHMTDTQVINSAILLFSLLKQ